MAKQRRTRSPKLPKRICADPYTKYCLGHKNAKYPYGHRGCCECHEVNGGEPDFLDWRGTGKLNPAPCNPYLLSERVAELKIWWAENYPEDVWDDDRDEGGNNWVRRNKKKRGGK